MTTTLRPPPTEPGGNRSPVSPRPEPGAEADAVDRANREGLRRMKVIATGLLVAATVVYIVAEALAPQHPWLGYVRAAAEAAMVGALADWFAVTALFRHPMRIPIPHTAIIPTRKNEIGQGLGTFVERHFLTADVVGERLSRARLADRLGRWLAEPSNARRVGDQASVVIRNVLDVLRDDEVQAAIEAAVMRKVRETNVAPLAGQALDVAMAEGRHQDLLSAVIRKVGEEVDRNQALLRARLAQESPWWVPEALDDRVFTKIVSTVRRLLHEVADDPAHPLRASFDQRMAELADDLERSPQMQARAEELKEEMLAHPSLRAWSAGVWSDIKQSVLTSSADPDSALRQRLEGALVGFGEALRDDADLQAKVDDWAASAVAELLDEAGPEVARFIAQTVERWDPADTSHRIELAVGRDLQFIRINGTVVGGLAGLVIYTVTQLVH